MTRPRNEELCPGRAPPPRRPLAREPFEWLEDTTQAAPPTRASTFVTISTAKPCLDQLRPGWPANLTGPCRNESPANDDSGNAKPGHKKSWRRIRRAIAAKDASKRTERCRRVPSLAQIRGFVPGRRQPERDRPGGEKVGRMRLEGQDRAGAAARGQGRPRAQ